MQKITVLLTLLASSVCFNTMASSQPEPTVTLETQLPSGQTLVIESGAGEAQSIGSYSVRLYQATEDTNKRTFFTSGLISKRAGTLESIELADLTNNGQLELIVLTRSVGSGNYVNATAYGIEQNQVINLDTSVDLAAEQDPIALLKQAYKEKTTETP